MVLEIWILQKDIECLSKLQKAWYHAKEDAENNAIRYMSTPPSLGGNEWICVHIGLNEFTNLKDNELLFQYTL